MCNRCGLTTPISEIAAIVAGVELPIVKPAPHELPNLPAREHIRPTDPAPILRPVEGGLQLIELRWGLIPCFYKGHVADFKGLNTNARAETAATLASFKGPFAKRRCLIPASHFFEWTGPKGSKVMWRFTRAGTELFCFAGLWERAITADGPVESFTMLTSAPGPGCGQLPRPAARDLGACRLVDLAGPVAAGRRAGEATRGARAPGRKARERLTPST